MPETLGDYLTLGLEKGRVVGPWTLLGAVVCLALGAVLSRRSADRRALGASVGVALALGYALATAALSQWDVEWLPAGHGKDWLLLGAIAAAVLAALESGRLGQWRVRWAIRLCAVSALAYHVALPATAGPGPEGQRWQIGIAVVGSLLTWGSIEALAPRLDARVLLTCLLVPLGALGGFIIQYGHEDGLGTGLIGLAMVAGLAWMVAMACRGELPTVALAAPLALLVPFALVAAAPGGLPASSSALMIAAVAGAPWVAGWRNRCDGTPHCRRGRALCALVATLALTFGAAADAHLRETLAAEEVLEVPAEDAADEPDLPY